VPDLKVLGWAVFGAAAPGLLTGCTGAGASAKSTETGPAARPDSGLECGTSEADALTVVTFNTGTTESMGAVGGTEDGYGPDESSVSDAHYGDGLAWLPAVEAARQFFAEVQPDVVGLQEIFWSGDCADIPEEARSGFYCEGWEDGDPTVAQAILGEDYQLACHPGKPDKCLAVHARVGRITGCEESFCLEGLTGATVEGCGSGARVGRAEVERPDGTVLVVVNVHGSSGLSPEDQACRVAQVEQVFVDVGGQGPAAAGEDVLIVGDLNTDPGRSTTDASADRWNDFVGPGHDFDWISAVGEDAPRSYQGIADIDHVAANARTGDCWIAGIDTAEVYGVAYFDHRPVVCTAQRP
jgi:hypothetical protein